MWGRGHYCILAQRSEKTTELAIVFFIILLLQVSAPNIKKACSGGLVLIQKQSAKADSSTSTPFSDLLWVESRPHMVGLNVLWMIQRSFLLLFLAHMRSKLCQTPQEEQKTPSRVDRRLSKDTARPGEVGGWWLFTNSCMRWRKGLYVTFTKPHICIFRLCDSLT